MSKLVSAIIPTRKRLDRLERTMQSMIGEADEPARIEFVLRLDNDDLETIRAVPRLAEHYGTSVVIGPRRLGYHSMGDFVSEACEVASGKWAFLIDDDCWIEGKGWDTKLDAIPCGPGHVAQCEYYKLNNSQYGSGSCGPVGLIVPNRCWRTLGMDRVSSPADDCWKHLLVRDNHWTIHLLHGVIYHHDRGTAEEMAAHKL